MLPCHIGVVPRFPNVRQYQAAVTPEQSAVPRAPAVAVSAGRSSSGVSLGGGGATPATQSGHATVDLMQAGVGAMSGQTEGGTPARYAGTSRSISRLHSRCTSGVRCMPNVRQGLHVVGRSVYPGCTPGVPGVHARCTPGVRRFTAVRAPESRACPHGSRWIRRPDLPSARPAARPCYSRSPTCAGYRMSNISGR